MGYIIVLCLGFFGGFFLGFGLGGPYPAESSNPLAQSLPADPLNGSEQREQQLLRQLASAQASCARSLDLDGENPEMDRNRYPANEQNEAEISEAYPVEDYNWSESEQDREWYELQNRQVRE